jgi:hypothetical protein
MLWVNSPLGSGSWKTILKKMTTIDRSNFFKKFLTCCAFKLQFLEEVGIGTLSTVKYLDNEGKFSEGEIPRKEKQ